MARLFTTASLRTRVGRRILTLFLICAVIPIAIVGVISYRQVASQLNQQARDRARQASEALGTSIFQRLLLLDLQLQMTATALREAGPGQVRTASSTDLTTQRFRSLALTAGNVERPTPLVGVAHRLPPPTAEQSAHLREGLPLAMVSHTPEGTAVFVVRPVVAGDPGRGLLWAEIQPAYLWTGGTAEASVSPPTDASATAEPEAGVLPGTDMCVFDGSGTTLFCSGGDATRLAAQLAVAQARAMGGTFDWSDGAGAAYLAGFWQLFLRYQFDVPDWTVTVSEPKASVLAPIAQFRTTFPLALLLTLWVVLLASSIQIRRTTQPLVELQEGTRRVARRDFGTKVHVRSGDEFEDLAASFNAMAHRLGRQFDALTTINEIDRQILSALDTNAIVDTVVTRMRDVLVSDRVCVCLHHEGKGGDRWTLVAGGAEPDTWVRGEVALSAQERAALTDRGDHRLLTVPDSDAGWLTTVAGFAAPAVRSALILPILANGELRAAIAVGYRNGAEPDPEDRTHARQLADQVAVALANSRLVSELDALSWETLIALARTIDAKSPWTAGHSERVTALADAIAAEMGLSVADRNTLHRGGLLHDIGKIGIPPEILDKDKPLTDAELVVMRNHVDLGVRILSPIGAYAPVIPIVRYHHERLDGSGYPDGLRGDQIPLLARVLAVPDVYDALTSNRPYREGWTGERSLAFMQGAAGILFDAEVVRALTSALGHLPRYEPAATTA